MPLSVPNGEDRSIPLPNFAFHVSFDLAAFNKIDDAMLGGFSDVTGLEATMEPKVIKAGGHNYGAIQRAGQVSFATVVLKRGVVESRHLWQWWSLFAGSEEATNGGYSEKNRSNVTIALMRERKPVLGWKLRNAMPTKFRVGDLNARGTELAVEELHLVHEGLAMEPAG